MKIEVVAKAMTCAAVAAMSACAPGQECSNLTDCSTGLVCSVDGTCVAREPVSARANDTGARPGLGAGEGGLGDGNDGNTDGNIDEGFDTTVGWTTSPDSTVVGTIGPVVVDALITPTFDPWTFIAMTSEGALVIVSGSGDGVLEDVLTTPGTRTYGTDSLEVAVYGATCTPEYDEPAEVEVVVSEPNEAGEIDVEITETNTASDVTVTTRLTPLS